MERIIVTKPTIGGTIFFWQKKNCNQIGIIFCTDQFISNKSNPSKECTSATSCSILSQIRSSISIGIILSMLSLLYIELGRKSTMYEGLVAFYTCIYLLFEYFFSTLEYSLLNTVNLNNNWFKSKFLEKHRNKQTNKQTNNWK